MIITKIRIEEEHPMTAGLSSWPLQFCDLHLNDSAGQNGYLIKNAVGLGPPQLTAVVDGFDAFGVPIMDSLSSKRDIVLRVGFMPRLTQSVSSLRDELYKFVSRSVRISFMYEATVLAQTTGFIRVFETLHFANQPEVQFTIECEDGYFSGPDSIPIDLDTLMTNQPVIWYEQGTAPTGFDLQFTYTSDEDGPGFTIFNHGKAWHTGTGDVTNIFDVSYTLTAGDIVTLSTQKKERRITLLRDGQEFDIAGYLNAGAVWPKLYAGVNVFEWSFDSSWMTWLSASYIPRFWGV